MLTIISNARLARSNVKRRRWLVWIAGTGNPCVREMIEHAFRWLCDQHFSGHLPVATFTRLRDFIAFAFPSLRYIPRKAFIPNALAILSRQ